MFVQHPRQLYAVRELSRDTRKEPSTKVQGQFKDWLEDDLQFLDHFATLL